VEDGLDGVKSSLEVVVTGNAEILDAVQNPGRSSSGKDWEELTMEERWQNSYTPTIYLTFYTKS
jgi:hypothetical protein